MKKLALFVLCALLLPVTPALAGGPLAGIYYICTNDPDQEKHFLGAPAAAMMDEVKQMANANCDDISGGVAIQITYLFKDGSTESN